jgi:hypothetical protein
MAADNPLPRRAGAEAPSIPADPQRISAARLAQLITDAEHAPPDIAHELVSALAELQGLREREPWHAVALATAHRDSCMQLAHYAQGKGDAHVAARRVRLAREHNSNVVRALKAARAAGVPGVRS